MRVVAGLGNPGPRYRWTRHNAGFRVVDLLAARAERRHPGAEPSRGVLARAKGVLGRVLGCSLSGKAALAGAGVADAWLAEVSLADEPVLLVKPLAFMNRSGAPIARALAARGASVADLVVVVDDVALELGTLRVRPRGRHGGHNGLRSVIEELGTEEFARVRIGVRGGELTTDLADYVLAEPPAEQAKLFEEALSRAAEAVECVLGQGLSAAMDRFNGRRT